MTYLGWFDPDKKRPVTEKLQDAVDRYQEKFAAVPTVCLTSHEDARLLADAGWHGHDVSEIEIQSVSYLPRHVFYVGEKDETAAHPAGAGAAGGDRDAGATATAGGCAMSDTTQPLTAEAVGRIAYEANRDLFDDPIPWARLDDDERPLFRNEAAAVAAAVLGAVEAIVRDRIDNADVADPTFLSVPENLHWNSGYRVACVGIVEDLAKLAREVAGG